jgi:hypothetical protein
MEPKAHVVSTLASVWLFASTWAAMTTNSAPDSKYINGYNIQKLHRQCPYEIIFLWAKRQTVNNKKKIKTP